MKKVKTIEIKNLQAPALIINDLVQAPALEELDELALSNVCGGFKFFGNTNIELLDVELSSDVNRNQLISNLSNKEPGL